MRTIKVEYQTTKSEGIFFTDVEVDTNCTIDELKSQISKWLNQRFENVISFKIDKFY